MLFTNSHLSKGLQVATVRYTLVSLSVLVLELQGDVDVRFVELRASHDYIILTPVLIDNPTRQLETFSKERRGISHGRCRSGFLGSDGVTHGDDTAPELFKGRLNLTLVDVEVTAA